MQNLFYMLEDVGIAAVLILAFWAIAWVVNRRSFEDNDV